MPTNLTQKQKPQLALLSLALLLALFTSCAKFKSESPAPPPSTNQAQAMAQIQPMPSLHEALAALASPSTLSCASADACPEQVGLLLAADSAGGFMADSPALAACTAVLAGEDLVLTNSHCIPSAVKLLPDLCGERIKFVLASTGGHSEESFSCKELIGFSERATPMSPDLALFRLSQKTTRAHLRLNRQGVPDSTVLRSYKINPNLQTLSGVLIGEQCQTKTRSYRMPIYRSATDPAIVLGDCHAKPGNSGSPLLDGNGRLVALLQADLPVSERASAEWSKHLDASEEKLAPLALATSLLCLRSDPAEGWHWNEACSTVEERDVALARPRIREHLNSPKVQNSLSAILEPFFQQSPWLGWSRTDLETKALTRQETLTPACLVNSSALPTSSTMVELQIPTFQLELRFNRFLQVTGSRARLLEVKNESYRFDAASNSISRPDGAEAAIALLPCPAELSGESFLH